MPFPIDKLFINQTEEKLGARLPLGYVAAMSKDNGGTVKTEIDYWEIHPTFDTSDKKRLKRTCNDIVRETKQAMDWPEFPTNAVAIGANGGGDLLVLLKEHGNDRFGDAVYWWDHETGELNHVADDFLDLQKR